MARYDIVATPECVDDLFVAFESRTNLERTLPQLRMYRLERMQELMERLDHPERNLRTIHIAGSKGKGTTGAYTASLLATAGQRTGFYTSPHVIDYRERFRLLEPGDYVGDHRDGFPTPEHEAILLAAGKRVWREVQALHRSGRPEEELPTTFELLTALAFCYYEAAACDWIVLETGLGGRLDATNVCTPRLTMLTRIEREHTEYLGETLTEIAGEKAGIIKTGVPVLVAPQRDEPMRVFDTRAGERSAPLVRVEPLPAGRARQHPPRHGDAPTAAPIGFGGATVQLPDWAGGGTVTLGMLGDVHRTNVAMALGALNTLITMGELDGSAANHVARAIASTRLAGRGEQIGGVVLDGAHTPESAAMIGATIANMLPSGARIPVILGIVAGKDIEGIARALMSIASLVIVSQPGRFKPGDPEDVARRVTAAGLTVEMERDPQTALARARAFRDAARTPASPTSPTGAPILVTGSFYMVAEIRRLLVSELATPGTERRDVTQ